MLILLPQFFIGALLIALTVVIHAYCLDFLLRTLDRLKVTVKKFFHRHWKVPVVICTVLGVFGSHIVQIWIWAFFYFYIGVMTDFEESLYFSTSTFTTVGYGDVVLGKEWRLVSSFQSANGFILFGWSTAFIFEIVSKLYEDDIYNAR